MATQHGKFVELVLLDVEPNQPHALQLFVQPLLSEDTLRLRSFRSFVGFFVLQCLSLQEDAQISNLNFQPGQAMFGVFDGHGGGEVARYVKRHFENGLKEIEEFKKENYQEGLR